MNSRKNAVFIILGQSNAVGHGIPLDEKDIIKEPLKNVFMLDREHNQSYDSTELCWSHFVSTGTNVAEAQDNTYSVPYCLAKLWQNEIDSGNNTDLPNLYIIQIAIGAQGVCDKYMWYPQREKKLVPGKLGTVDISLFPLANHIFSLLDESFEKMGEEYEIIGLHWRGGEEDTQEEKELLEKELEKIYIDIFDSFNEILKYPPIVLHRIVCPDRFITKDPSGRTLENMRYVNLVFENLEKKYPNADIFDMRKAPHFIPDVKGNGLFIDDFVHFTPESNFWLAGTIIEDYKKR